MSEYTIEDLEEQLATPADVDRLGGPDLGRIRSRGGRRRRLHQAAGAGAGVLGAAAVVGMLFGGAQLFGGGGDSQAAEQPARPHELSPLARRALAEIPGAVQVSDWQVVLPDPDVPIAVNDNMRLRIPQPAPPGPVELPGHLYTGVTRYERGVFPKWLHDGVAAAERKAGDGNSWPASPTTMGIMVDQGVGAVACTRVGVNERGEPERLWLRRPAPRCDLSLLSRARSEWYQEMGFGGLDPGSKMQVLPLDDYSTGRLSTLAIAELDSTEVERVDFVPVTGDPVEGRIESGTVVAGDSIAYANVPGELARVIAYDADNKVIASSTLHRCKDVRGNYFADCQFRSRTP